MRQIISGPEQASLPSRAFLNRAFLIPLTMAVGIFVFLFFSTFDSPLQGTHVHRQAATLFPAWSYCVEDTSFLYPRIPHRGLTDGVSIGEFPLYSYLLSLPCQLSGQWDEWSPKIINLVFLALMMVVWGFFLRVKNWWVWLTLLFFSQLHLAHHTIIHPDGFTLLLIGLSGILFRTNQTTNAGFLGSRSLWAPCLGGLVFCLAFLIRPYFIPLLWVVAPKRKQWMITFVVCAIGYLIWYKYWISHSEIKYFATELRTPMELFQQVPLAVGDLIKQIGVNHFNYLGLIFFIIGSRANHRLWILWIASVAMVLVFKGSHFVHHGYYLFASATIGVILMYQGFEKATISKKYLLLGLYALIGVSLTQHFWHRSRPDYAALIPKMIEESGMGKNEKLAVYGSDDPKWLYWAKRTGWLELGAFGGTCVPGAQFALYFTPQLSSDGAPPSDKEQIPHLVRCQ